MKGVIAYNLLQVSMAQMYAFGSEQAVNFIKNINTLINIY